MAWYSPYEDEITQPIDRQQTKSSESTVVLSMQGWHRKKNGRPYISIASDEQKSLVIYTDTFSYTLTYS